MKRQSNNDQLSEWLKSQLADLRKQLEEWPPTADQLLHHLTEPEQPITVEEEDMLSLVVNDALQGVDIIKQYPAFYQKLLTNDELRQTFLDALDLLEKSQSGNLAPLPQSSISDLAFLKSNTSQTSSIEYSTSEKWRITWQLLQEQLSSLFMPIMLSDSVYRSNYGDLDDTRIFLLRSQVDIEHTSLDVFLEAVRPIEEANNLHLYLSLASSSEIPLPTVQAHFYWGALHQTAIIDQYNYAHFQPFPLKAVFDEETQTFYTDLQLTLESINEP